MGTGRDCNSRCVYCPSRKARIKDYQPDAAYATTVRMYNPNTEAWDILYTELGGATQLEGKREGNRNCSDGN